MRQVRYIGKQKNKRDRLTGSNTIWPAPNSVRAMDDQAAAKLVKHSHFEYADEPNQRSSPVSSGQRAESPEKETTGNGEAEAMERQEISPMTAERLERIQAAIMELDPQNPEHFDQQQRPRVPAIRHLIGEPLTAADRDEAWQHMDAE